MISNTDLHDFQWANWDFMKHVENVERRKKCSTGLVLLLHTFKNKNY